MLYWECKRRLAELRKFRELTATYFSHRNIVRFRYVHEDEAATKARGEIIGDEWAAQALDIMKHLTQGVTPSPKIKEGLKPMK